MGPKLVSDTKVAIREAIKELMNDDQFLEAIYKKVEEKLNELEQKVDTLEKHIDILENKIENLYQNEKQHNLCIYGIPEERNENLKKKLKDLFTSTMEVNIDESDIIGFYRLGNNTGKIRPVVVKFEKLSIRNHIYDNCKRLKGTKLAISEDLTKSRLQLLKEIKSKVDKRSVRTFKGKIYVYVDGKRHTVSSMEDLNKIIQ